MAGMAVLTADTGLVRAAIGRNVGRRSRMTLDTVRTGQNRPVGSQRSQR